MYGEYECETCNRDFSSQHAADQHMNARSHWARRYDCQTCDYEFFSQWAVNAHMDDTGHWMPQYECETCDRKFHSQNAVNQHMNDTRHWTPQFECDVCDRKFQSHLDANQHMDVMGHFARRYCRTCNRGFESENQLKMHLNSSVHRGKNVVCPFCKAAFTTASGLSHHLETGSCPQAKSLNREKLYQAIGQRDPSGLITKKLLTCPDFTAQYHATDAAWNGSRWECYLCHRQYNTVRALNQHLNSPAHSEKLYHCPNRQCSREFVSLASLFNHLESESCRFIRFEQVQESVHEIITGRQKLLGFA